MSTPAAVALVVCALVFLGCAGWAGYYLARARLWAASVEAREVRVAEVAGVSAAATTKIADMTPEEVEDHARKLLSDLRARDGGAPRNGSVPRGG
jgi:hypothetical protein